MGFHTYFENFIMQLKTFRITFVDALCHYTIFFSVLYFLEKYAQRYFLQRKLVFNSIWWLLFMPGRVLVGQIVITCVEACSPEKGQIKLKVGLLCC